jgi:type I restriction enzyme R subunit
MMNFILEQEDGKKRYRKAVTELSQSFSLSVPNLRAIQIRDEVGLFQEIKAVISKELSDENEMSIDDYDAAINQIVSNAVSSTEVVDIFKAAGLDHPDVSILSDEFLDEIKGLKYKSVALEILKKLLDDKIRSISRRNVIKSRSFAELLEKTIKKYQNKTVEAAQIIAELIDLAKEIRGEVARGNAKGLTDDELAFYDALADNESAMTELGDDTLKTISKELVKMLRKNTTIDWTLKENVRARIRVYVKRLLREYKYPPDMQDSATQLVLEQAETLCKEWSGKDSN